MTGQPPHAAEDTTDAAIQAVLEAVGPRLRRARELQPLTLTDVADRTGVSKSTLSRLENARRPPTLELLLAFATVYRIPLDDLVGAPETGDRGMGQMLDSRTSILEASAPWVFS